jgi:hypothetical protein
MFGDQPVSLALRVASALLGIGQGLERYMNEQRDTSAGSGSLAVTDALMEDDTSDTLALSSLTGAVAFVTLGVASDHLRATHPLIVDHRGRVSVFRYAVYSVLRVAMEVSALTWWMVDKRVSPRTRLTRVLTVMEDSRRQRQRAEQRLGDRTEFPYLAAMKVSVEELARKHHLQKIVSRLDEGKEVRVPDAVDLIGLHFREASDGAEGEALAIYGMLSEPMHGSILGTMMGFDSPEHQTGPLRPGVSTYHLVAAANLTGHAVASAMLWFVMYMGWDHDKWIGISQPHMDDLNDVLRDAKHLMPQMP